MKILLATPAYDASVNTNFYRSVVALLKHCHRTRPELEFGVTTISKAVIFQVRNQFATHVLLDASFSHLLMIDADMGFEPVLIEKMIDLDKPVVGCVSPVKAADAVTGAPEFVHGPELERILSDAEQRSRRVRDGFIQVDRVGAGIMLIKRGAIEQLREKFPELWVDDIGYDWTLGRGMFHPFAPERQENGRFMGEDISFCLRWTRGCGGEIWANVSEQIGHMGRHEFKGSLLSKLRGPTAR